MNGDVEAIFRRAVALHRQGAVADAGLLYQDVLRDAPQHVEALHLSGVAAMQLGQHQRGVDFITRALALKPDHAEAHANLGNGLKALGRLPEALASYDRALALKPGLAEAHFNRAGALQALQRPAEAIASFDAAIAADARFAAPQTWLDRAIAFSALGRASDALESVGRALERDPDYVPALAWRAFLFLDMKRLEEARDDLARVLKSGAELDYVRGYWLHAKMQLCDWRDFEAEVAQLFAAVEAGRKASHPFPLLAMADRPDVHRRCAELFAPPAQPRAPFAAKAEGEKIRVGYFSSDFHDHPVAHLATPLLENHDRSRFEIVAYSMGRKRDGWQERVRRSVDRFLDASAMSAPEIAAMAQRDGLDIAVDLSGHTANNRTGVFAARVAPVQMSYLGYLGSMGASYMDYLVADATIIPPDLRSDYAEKIVSLPWYQCNDAAIPLGAAPARADHGLPGEAFVFASFNNGFKITPALFSSWMRILSGAPGSVLWLFAGNETAAANLRTEAQARGVDARRLVFADKVAMAEHLSRQRLADLCLDTFPYNGGATTSNALRAGLPVLTLCGRSFASRMGASLLAAARAPALIATEIEAYEARAIQFAQSRAALGAARQSMSTAALFDASAFARNMEAAYEAALRRYRQGLAPDHITIS
ncbi:tetratricopeptide repeat protein [Terricaulis sp.]|uniref:O-linked N-acetylglucosamine transferase, SPINDLY family protein n=1 Tax=Terricaulis sp. TaxID=2768686 RepID=UPI003782FD02